MRKSLLGMYHALREAGSQSDFPYLMANTMHKKMIGNFKGFPSPWKQYVGIGDLADFKAHDRTFLGESPDLQEIADEGNYPEAKLKDYRYQISAKTFGLAFTVGRKVIINDDLNALTRVPELFGRAAVRTMVKKILFYLKGGQNAYDGSTLFALRAATTRNYIVSVALANSETAYNAVVSACQRMRTQADPDNGELLGVEPWGFLTGSTLAPIARRLLKGDKVWPISTSGGGEGNPLSFLNVIEEPLIDSQVSASFWAIIANPAVTPFIEAGFLQGKQEPELLVQMPTMARIAGGGEDPYDYEFDELHYKVRHDHGVQLAMYQGICRGSG